MKIALGENFKKNSDLLIKDIDFIQHFFTYFYFTKPDASIENFSMVLNVGSNDLYKYVYFS
jgi:hypothetical protein